VPKKVLSFSPLVRLAANAGTGMMWYSKMLAARLLPLPNQHTCHQHPNSGTEPKQSTSSQILVRIPRVHTMRVVGLRSSDLGQGEVKASLSGASTVTLSSMLSVLARPEALMTCARSESWGVAWTAWSSVVLQVVCTVAYSGQLPKPSCIVLTALNNSFH
jgi:hypothetical protein